jgi:hypothetical protein
MLCGNGTRDMWQPETRLEHAFGNATFRRLLGPRRTAAQHQQRQQ